MTVLLKSPQRIHVERIKGENIIAADTDDQQTFFVGELVRTVLIVDGGHSSHNLFVGNIRERNL